MAKRDWEKIFAVTFISWVFCFLTIFAWHYFAGPPEGRIPLDYYWNSRPGNNEFSMVTALNPALKRSASVVSIPWWKYVATFGIMLAICAAGPFMEHVMEKITHARKLTKEAKCSRK